MISFIIGVVVGALLALWGCRSYYKTKHPRHPIHPNGVIARRTDSTPVWFEDVGGTVYDLVKRGSNGSTD